MPSITVKRGVQFRADLYSPTNQDAWLDAVGKELEAKGLSLTVGQGTAAKVVKDATTLRAAMSELKSQAYSASQPLHEYVTELVEALDDVVRPDSTAVAGDTFDLSAGSKLSTALGLGDGTRRNYGAPLKASGPAAIDGVTAQLWASPDGVDLSSVPHMSAETLRGAPVSYGRDGEEVEDTRVITGLSTAETVKLAANALNDLQRPKAVAGLTLGFVGLDEMEWDAEAHALRRANPYVSFTLDNRSYELNPDSGKPRVAVGRDFFVDVFMAKKDLRTGELTKDLQKADLMYRARVRYGSDKDPFAGTRVLVGVKEGTAIVDGVKHAAKIDSRTDSVTQATLDGLMDVAQNGVLNEGWSSYNAGAVAPAAASMYRIAVQRGITENLGGETNVLAVEPGAVARQIRGRFHLNETPRSAVLQGFLGAGEPKVKELAALIEAAPDWAASGGRPSRTQLLAQANALLDRSAVVAAATDALRALDPSLTVDKALIDRLWPGQTPLTSKADVKLQRAVVDAIRSTYDGFADQVDALQRRIGGTEARTVRDAGRGEDVVEYLRLRAAVARFQAHAERNGATRGDVASYLAYAKRVTEMPDGKEKTELLQTMGVGLRQVRALTEALLASPVAVKPELAKQQTVGGFLAELDAQLAGPQREAFLAELGAFLGEKGSPALKDAAEKGAVAAHLRANLVTKHVDVLHRMVEGAGAWAQGTWFNDYRRVALGISGQTSNFLIASMDYSEFYDAKTGLALPFEARTSRKPLDPTTMKGAMISNDIQIELEAEEAYTKAVRKAQYAVNAGVAGLLMDYALSTGVTGVTAGDPASFERWFAQQAGQRPLQRQAFVDDLTAFAKSKGSPLDVAAAMAPLEAQEKAITVLTAFALQKEPTLTDRASVQAWYRTKGALPETQLVDLLTEVAQFAAGRGTELPLSPALLQTLEFLPFDAANVGKPADVHATLVDDLAIAREVWGMMKQAQKDLSAARGAEVQRVLRDNGLGDKGWDAPTSSKGDYAINFALG